MNYINFLVLISLSILTTCSITFAQDSTSPKPPNNLRLVSQDPPNSSPSVLEGRVFLDLNNNQIDDIEAGVEGISVNLLDTSLNKTVKEALTNGTGTYRFTDVAPGSYIVHFQADPDGKRYVVGSGSPTEDISDSDIVEVLSGGIGRTPELQVKEAKTYSHIDAGLAPKTKYSPTGHLRVLFIGTSRQYYKPLALRPEDFSTDGQFMKMIEAAGGTVVGHGTYWGGGTLVQLWNDDDNNRATDHLKSKNYDLTIINSGNKDVSTESFQEYATKFSELASQNSVDVLFYQVHAPNHKISISNGSDYTISTTADYLKAATDNNRALAPHGIAYQRVYSALTELYGNGDNGETAEEILTDDNVHPTPIGAYLAAASIYIATFGEKPPSTSLYLPPGVKSSDADLMVNIAWSTFQEHGIGLNNLPQ